MKYIILIFKFDNISKEFENKNLFSNLIKIRIKYIYIKNNWRKNIHTLYRWLISNFNQMIDIFEAKTINDNIMRNDAQIL